MAGNSLTVVLVALAAPAPPPYSSATSTGLSRHSPGNIFFKFSIFGASLKAMVGWLESLLAPSW
jgi:hypothetical protein